MKRLQIRFPQPTQYRYLLEAFRNVDEDRTVPAAVYQLIDEWEDLVLLRDLADTFEVWVGKDEVCRAFLTRMPVTIRSPLPTIEIHLVI